MSEQTFIGYIQEPDVHDGVIITAEYKSGFLRSAFDKRRVMVMVLTYDERLFGIVFNRVRSASITNVEGMRLYSLSEMYERPPFRRFVFVDSEEESNRQLEVIAREISSVELTEDFIPQEARVHLRDLYPRKPR
jgi:hypothetical protein